MVQLTRMWAQAHVACMWTADVQTCINYYEPDSGILSQWSAIATV